MAVGGCRSLVAEHWRLKPEALGSIPSGTTFLPFPLPFQRSTDSNGPDYLYRSSDLGEPRLSGSQCCDKSSRFFRNYNHSSQLYFHQPLITLFNQNLQSPTHQLFILSQNHCIHLHTTTLKSIVFYTSSQLLLPSVLRPMS